jgi:hypothetical protein
MAEKTFGEEFREEVAGKAAMWGLPFVGAALLGPVVMVLGIAAAAAKVVSDATSTPSAGDPSRD